MAGGCSGAGGGTTTGSRAGSPAHPGRGARVLTKPRALGFVVPVLAPLAGCFVLAHGFPEVAPPGPRDLRLRSGNPAGLPKDAAFCRKPPLHLEPSHVG